MFFYGLVADRALGEVIPCGIGLAGDSRRRDLKLLTDRADKAGSDFAVARDSRGA
jgi:hypothetical protein